MQFTLYFVIFSALYLRDFLDFLDVLDFLDLCDRFVLRDADRRRYFRPPVDGGAVAAARIAAARARAAATLLASAV